MYFGDTALDVQQIGSSSIHDIKSKPIINIAVGVSSFEGLSDMKIRRKQSMALFYLVRHGQPDYSPCDERGYIGHGRDLAPLSEEGIDQAERTAKDVRLMGADIIVSSPYTRALQTAAIISKNTGIDIKVEMDLHEWMPDLTFQYKEFPECLQLNEDFNKHQGVYTEAETLRWECLQHLRERVRKVADKYADYNKVIIVCHGMVIRTLTYAEEIKPAEIIVCKYVVGQPDCIYSFA